MMLLPIFSLPVSGSVFYSRAQNNDSNQFEPVNEELPIWTEAFRSLNAKIEAWTTPLRAENIFFDEGDDDTKTKTKKDKKDVKPGDDKNKIAPVEDPPAKHISKKPEGETSKSKTENKNPTTTKAKKSAALVVSELPTSERGSIYSYENNPGTPPGKTEADSLNQAAALRIRHRAGVANFSFALPLASLSGRNINAGIGLTYNSRTWNKSVNASQQDHYTYDVEQSWIAPGFLSGLGYLETSAELFNVAYNPPGNYWHTQLLMLGLTDADGTRHQLDCKSYTTIPSTQNNQQRCAVYGTTDGTLLEFTAKGLVSNPGNSTNPNTAIYNNTSFTTTYPDGTKVWYSTGFGSGTHRKHYPFIIQDRNGNRNQIAYKGDPSGRIDYIIDTLNRQIKFYYENDGGGNPDKLVAITIPGMGTNDEIQTIRFYYETMTLSSAGKFVGEITAPSSIRVLRYVYMPATKTGFKYDYHSNYGMIKKITRFVGMTASSTSTSSTGSITSDGLFAASTEYDFPDGSTALTDVPKYTKRTDDWQGRTASTAQETLYDQPTGSGELISRITVKDTGFDVQTETISETSGLLKETSIKKIYGPSGQYSQLMSKSKYTWTGLNLTKLEVTNEANLTRKTEIDYDQYNNQTEIREYDYGTSSPTLLRTTQITYETGSGWITNRLLRLPKSVKTIVNSVTVAKTLYEYDHNGSDAYLTPRGAEVPGHDPTYNPDSVEICTIVCIDDAKATCENPGRECDNPTYSGGYNPATKYRGNVTKVTAFADATQTSDSNADVTETEYDILGNIVSSSLNCCHVRTYGYSSTYFAFVTSQTEGSSPTQLTTYATYNSNTGLMLTSTDENSQVTSYEYESDTLRPKKTTFANGGYIETEYSDKLITTTNDLLPGFIRKTTTLDSSHIVQNYNYFNGRGDGIRSATQTPDGWSVSATDFDKLGRGVKSYNPFFVSTPTGAIPSGTKYVEITGIDALGRTTEVKRQDNTTFITEYSTDALGTNKTFVTLTDEAGKKRRQIFDALARMVRVDEPDLNGSLGDVSSPNQPTAYEYDGSSNLTKVTQSDGTNTQERLFKYDSLSRLTHEKQVEAVATLNDAGTKVTSGGLWTRVLKYNTDGLMTEIIDARGVKATLAYDGLNRVSSVTYTGESGYSTPTVNYTYDEERSGFYNEGRLTKVTTAAVTGSQGTPATEQIYDYNKMGEVVKHQQKIDGQSYTLEYGYNLSGQLTSEKYPSGRTVNIGHDANGRLASVADAQRTYLSGVSFGSVTLPSQMNFGNGTTQSLSSNDRLQMTNQTFSKGSEVLLKYDYAFGQIDSNGNVDTTKNNGQLARIESYIGSAKQWTQKFKYDSIGRLKESEEKRGDTSALTYKQVFDFDRFGNMYRKSASNPTSGQENPLPYTAIENSDISKTTNKFTSNTTYDDAGFVTTDNKFRSMGFSYDANGRMIKATKTSVPDALSVYDALGNRVATKVNDIWQFVIYDAFGNLVAEYGGTPLTDDGGVKYILQDWQGSVRAILGNTGIVQSRKDYTAFGEEIQSGVGLRTTGKGFGSAFNTRRGYASTERDDSTGLDHTWFRKNENHAGRWTSPDPYFGSMSLANPQSFNRYSYVENQPTNFIDPSGLLWVAYRCWCVDGNVPGWIDPNPNCDICWAWIPDWLLGDSRMYDQNGMFPMEGPYGTYWGDPPGQQPTPGCGGGSGPVSGSGGSGNSVDIRYGNGDVESRTGGTRSWRNNNPGNVRSSSTQIGQAGGFAIFSNEAAGQEAKVRLLTGPNYGGLSLGAAIAKWAPPSENNTPAYQRYVQNQTGIGLDTTINSMSQGQVQSVSDAMRNYEGWKPGNVTCRRSN